MAFIGNTNTTQAFTPAVDFFSGNASTTAFTLSRPVASVAQVQAVVNNVAQNPSDAFTVSGNTITFTSAPSSGTNNIYVYYTSPITQVIAPGQGTVTTTSLASSTGTGAVVLATSPTLVTPVLGAASATSITVAAGAVGTPSITTTGDTNTGIFFPAADTIGFAEGGAEVMRIDSSGNVGIGTASPSGKLNVISGSVAQLIIGFNATSASYLDSDAIVFRNAATSEAGRFTSTGLFQFNSGYGSSATAYGCRAWVNFNGTGVVAIRASGNVTSITDNGTADYTVNFTTAMPDTNYSVSGNCMANIAPGNNARMMVLYPNTTYSNTFAVGSVRILAQDYAGGVGADALAMTVSIFR